MGGDLRSQGAAQYDSAPDTLEHIEKVRANIRKVKADLSVRSIKHDASKLVGPEKPIFDRIRPLLDTCDYGSDEYKRLMVDLRPALDHHFAHNRHHPEHHVDGVDGMNLLDLIEMVCDWQAAAMRKPDGDVRHGLTYNYERYGIVEQLANVIENTVEALWPSL